MNDSNSVEAIAVKMKWIIKGDRKIRAWVRIPGCLTLSSGATATEEAWKANGCIIEEIEE